MGSRALAVGIFCMGHAALSTASARLLPSPSDASQVRGEVGDQGLSSNNINPRQPAVPIYPSADARDAPYDVPEATLRAAIRIPPGFRYGASGAPPPVLLLPATATTGYESFAGSFIPLLTGSTVGDPVWLNIPNGNLDDMQTNVEYIAYAINYMHAISGQRPMALVGLSQGGLAAQWAFKYWPSTRSKISDNMQISPAYRGSTVGNLTEMLPLAPALMQQRFMSKLVRTLASDHGDSAYVPTTVVYSSYIDQVVQPTTSALLYDVRGVGVTNNEVQKICNGQLAGGLYTHEGVLYNPLSWALFVDAMANPGPGRPERLDLQNLCPFFLSPDLTVGDYLTTESLVVTSITEGLLYPDKVSQEPPLKPYATQT